MALFCCQTLMIVAVILEVDQDQFYEDFDVAHVHIWQFTAETKLVLIVVVQIMVNRELRQSAEMFIFFLNPSYWASRHIPDYLNEHCSNKMSWLYTKGALLAPLVLLASLAKLVIAYYTSVSSISIIWRASTLTSAIFNSLALTFIKDLDEAVWELLSNNFRLKLVNVKAASLDEKRRANEGVDTTHFKFLLEPLKQRHKAFPARIWHKGILRRLLVCLLLWQLYQNQLFMSIDVLRTGWLPSSRQACWLWRVEEEKDGAGWFARVFGSFLRVLFWEVLSGAQGRLIRMADPEHGGYCNGNPEESFLSWTDKENLFWKYPASIIVGVVIVVIMVILPQLIQIILQELAERAALEGPYPTGASRARAQTVSSPSGPGMPRRGSGGRPKA